MDKETAGPRSLSARASIAMKWIAMFLSGVAVGLAIAVVIVLNLPELPVYIRYLV